MFNKVVIVGHLTRDVELRYIPTTGTPIVTIGVACSRKSKRKDGNIVEEVCFIDCKLFGRTAEIANQYLKKGSKILVEGRLAQEHWESNGQKKSKHIIQGESIQMLDSKPAEQTQSNQTQTNYAQAYQNAPSVDLSQQLPNTEMEDTIPF